jgi:hypothetical protein
MEENPIYEPFIFDVEPQSEQESPNSACALPCKSLWHSLIVKYVGYVPSHTIRSWPVNDPMLCPPWVHGFSPSLKQWCKFYIDQIEDANWKPNAFDSLILPDEPKRVIRCLVSSHQYPEDGVRDQQDLKGKGLVILLHGSPGTGNLCEILAELVRC